jgi:ATP adenylyltransferase
MMQPRLAMTRTCRLCKIMQNASSSVFDVVLLASENFVVLPARGHFCPGYLMLVSKQHMPNFAQIHNAHMIKELEILTFRTRCLLQVCFGRSIVYEHGSLGRARSAGSSVDHAHLHFIPTEIDLVKRLSASHTLLQVDRRQRLPSETPYLYIQNQSGSRFLANVNDNLESQYLRKLAYEALYPNKRDDGWDWRVHPHTEFLKDTLKMIRLPRRSYKIRVYLALAMDGLSVRAIRSRIWYLKNCVKSLPVDLFTTPLETVENTPVSSASAHTIVEEDLAMLRNADILLVDYSKRGRNYVGCTCEIVYAYLLNKPIIAYTGRSGNHDRPWLLYHASFVCRSMRQVVDSLKHLTVAEAYGPAKRRNEND